MDLKQQEKQNYREHARLHRERLDFDAADFEVVIDVFFENFPKIQNNCHPCEGRDLNDVGEQDSGLRRNDGKDLSIALYSPVGKEFDCRFLMDELVKRGYTCALPVIEKDSRVLKFKQWTPDTKMIKGAFGIAEPANSPEIIPDVIIAPLLAFDQKGYRLGQGGGYYDATLEALRQRKPITFMGIGHAEQAVLFKLPREDHDIPLDYMLTPKGVIDFTG